MRQRHITCLYHNSRNEFLEIHLFVLFHFSLFQANVFSFSEQKNTSLELCIHPISFPFCRLKQRKADFSTQKTHHPKSLRPN